MFPLLGLGLLLTKKQSNLSQNSKLSSTCIDLAYELALIDCSMIEHLLLTLSSFYNPLKTR